MTISTSPSYWTFFPTFGSNTHQITLPVARPSANSSIVLCFLDRTGNAVVTGVSDSVNGSWGPPVSTYQQGSSHVSSVYVYKGSDSGTPTVTLTTSASQNSQLLVGWVEGTDAAPEFDIAATVLEQVTPETNWDSNTVSASGAGAIIGFLAVNNTQTNAPTLDGAGESGLIANSAGVRVWAFFEQYATAGNYGFEVTLDTAAIGSFHVIALKEASGVATVSPDRAALSLDGLFPGTSAFQNVRIREVLVNGSGQAVGNASDITLLVWYSGRFEGAPDLSLTGLTTDPNGTTSWSIATGPLNSGDPIAWVAQNSVSLSHYTAARMIPSYE